MSDVLTDDGLIAAVDSGQTVSEIAEAHGVTSGAVYQRLRRINRSATQIAAQRAVRATTRVQSHLCPSYPGYRVLSDGRIQSSWSRGRYTQQTEHWRDLTISHHHDGRSGKLQLYVTIGSSSGRTRQRLSIRTLYRDAYGTRRQDAADQLWERMVSAAE